MKYKLLLILGLIICLLQCSVHKQNQYFDRRFEIVNAEFYKIEEKNNIYVYYFKNDTMTGIFAKEKNCSNPLKSWKKVQLNKNYKLVLKSMLVANVRMAAYEISINNDFVWIVI